MEGGTGPSCPRVPTSPCSYRSSSLLHLSLYHSPSILSNWWLSRFRSLFYFRLHLPDLSYSPHFKLMDFYTLVFSDHFRSSDRSFCYMIHHTYDLTTISILDVSMIFHQHSSFSNTITLSPYFCANGLIAHRLHSPRFVIRLINAHLHCQTEISVFWGP